MKINKMSYGQVVTALKAASQNCPGSLYERHLQARKAILEAEWQAILKEDAYLDDDLYLSLEEMREKYAGRKS